MCIRQSGSLFIVTINNLALLGITADYHQQMTNSNGRNENNVSMALRDLVRSMRRKDDDSLRESQNFNKKINFSK